MDTRPRCGLQELLRTRPDQRSGVAAMSPILGAPFVALHAEHDLAMDRGGPGARDDVTAAGPAGRAGPDLELVERVFRDRIRRELLPVRPDHR